jgi:hypothetical protein
MYSSIEDLEISFKKVSLEIESLKNGSNQNLSFKEFIPRNDINMENKVI